MSDILARLKEAFESDSIYVKQAAVRDAITEIERLRKELAEHRDKAAAIETMETFGFYVVPYGSRVPRLWTLRTEAGHDMPIAFFDSTKLSILHAFRTPTEALLAARLWVDTNDV